MGKRHTRAKRTRRGRKKRGGRLARTLVKAAVPFGLLMTQKRMQARRRKSKSKRKRR